MTFKSAARVQETSTTTGTGTYTLAGAPAGFQAFSVMGANNTCPYYATDGTNWEEGIGTVLTGPARLERTHVLASSNAGAAVNWGAGTRTLRCAPIGFLHVQLTESVDAAGSGTSALTVKQQRVQQLVFTGTLTGNRIYEVDASPWTWIVHNNTSGAFTFTLRVAGQTGIALRQGRRHIAYCDGVDVRRGAVAPSGDSEFATGTAIVFQQSSAPVGWTKQTTHNDKALRVVSGTASSGGATAFSSVFGAGKTAGAFTLTAAHLPNTVPVNTGGTGNATVQSGASTNVPANNSTSYTAGGGGSHDHTLSLDLQFLDVVVCTKD